MDLTKDRMAPLTTTRGFTGEPGMVGRRQAPGLRVPASRRVGRRVRQGYRHRAIQPVIKSPSIGEHPLAWSHDGRSLLIFTSDDDKAYLSAWSFASRTLTRFVGPGAVESAVFSPAR